jgi:zinc transport system substrate-binding protein
MNSRSTGSSQKLILALVLVVLGWAMTGCGAGGSEEEGLLRIAVSNSYLEVVVRDLMGEGAAVFRLAEPGSCPGHFDLRPSQARRLRDCHVLLRFDFQEGFHSQGVGSYMPLTAAVTPAGGLGLPQTYLDACRQTGASLVEAGLLAPADLDASLQRIERRLDQLSQTVRAQIADVGWAGRPVVTSHRQEDLCAWLGLEVVARFGAADATRPSAIDQVIALGERSKAQLVIANEPEGTRLAQALADRLRVGLIVWANFPSTGTKEAGFDAMLRANTAQLIAALP